MRFYFKHKIVILLIFLLFGIISVNLFQVSTSILFVLLTILLTLFLITGKEIFFIVIFIPAGFQLAVDSNKPNYLKKEFINKNISINATLLKNPQKRIKSNRIFIRINSIIGDPNEKTTETKAVLYSKNDLNGILSGDRILIKNIVLNEIEEFKNPGSFSLKKHYRKRGIHYSGFIDKSYQIEIIETNSIFPFLRIINKFRKNYENFVREKLTFPVNEILIALTIGERGGIPYKIQNNFSYLGISHLLAISGLHLGFIALIIYFIIKWVLKRSEYMLLMYEVPKIASLWTILPLLLYTLIAGFALPVVRAFIMISLYLLSVFLGRQDNKINILAAAAIIILIIDTNSLYNLSFQLSFTAVGGILLFNKIIPCKFYTTGEKILSTIKTTAAATLFTLPLVVNSFGYLPVLTIPANLISVPLVELLIVPTGLVSIIFYTFSPQICEIILKINNNFINFLIKLAKIAGDLDFADYTVTPVSGADYIIFSLILLFLLLSPYITNLRYIVICMISIFLLQITNHKIDIKNKLEINFLDSGYKSYSLINIPNGQKILISSGYSRYGENDYIEKAGVIPFMLKKRITNIDYLWLFSTDKSQLKGAAALAQRLKINSIWTNGKKLDGQLWEIIKEKDIKWKNLQEELEQFEIDNTKFRFIKPFGNNTIWDSKQPRPLLLLINNENNNILLGEGINLEAARNSINIHQGKIDVIFLNKYHKASEINIFKFLEKFEPEYVIANKGGNLSDQTNMFEIFETETDGMITVVSNHNSVLVKKFLQD